MAGQSNGARDQRPKPMTNNEVVSAEQQLGFVLAQLNVRKNEICSVLPNDIPFDTFHATVNQALRNNPAILGCYGPSIVNACIKAAYDGLRLDGREATMTVDNVKIQKNPDKWRQEARYMPMVFGLRKQILQSGMVLDVFTMLVWEKEPFEVIGGVNRDILHKVLPDTERGKKLKACYSVAVLKSGLRTFEVMWRSEIDAIKLAAKTDFVWNAWEGEMWRKSVLRRHRKSLPSTRDIVDSEAREIFPQFDKSTGHPQLAAPTGAPRRQDFIEAPKQTFDYDLTQGRELDPVDRGDGPVIDGENKQKKERQTPVGHSDGDVVDQNLRPMPIGPVEWASWHLDVETKITATRSMAECDALFAASGPAIEAAPADIADSISSLFSDRLADLATDTDAGAAAATGSEATAAEKVK